ncbi:MAG: insulinase family protein, partial [Sphingomonadaceae bacterium]|nr:insulinase family protein [Sphingomonadaceae bacterium]
TYEEQPRRSFTDERKQRLIRHTGPDDQALLRLVWPTRDDTDPVATLTLELLERVARIAMTETLRESLGKAYSPGASSRLSRHWPGYGTFSLTASVAVAEVPAATAAISSTLTALQTAPIDSDMLQRARQPMVEQLQNALKSNPRWLSLVDRAQSESARIARFIKARDRLLALAPADLQAAAKTYLDPHEALEILVLPEGIDPPA